MGKFIKGDVVVLPFPFTDLSNAKKRPALIISDLNGNDYIMLFGKTCIIISQIPRSKLWDMT